MSLMSVPQVAERMAISVETVRRLVRKGDLAHSRAGCQIRISEQQLQAYLHRDPDAERVPTKKTRAQAVRIQPAPEVNWGAFQTKARQRKAAG